MNLASIVTNESLSTDVDGVQVPVVETVEPSLTEDNIEVIETLSQVQAAADENDQIGDAVDEAFAASDTIDEVQGVVKDIDEEGRTIDPMTEKMIATTMESISAALGVTLEVPSLESVSYADRAGSVVATLEAAKEGILARAAKALKAAMETVWLFIQNLLSNTWMLEKMHKKALEAVENAKSSTKTPDPTMTTMAKEVSIGGVAEAKNTEMFAKTAEDLLDVANRAADKINEINFNFSEKGGSFSMIFHSLQPSGFSRVKVDGEDTYSNLTGDRHYRSKGESRWEVATFDKPAEKADVLNQTEQMQAIKTAGDIINGLKALSSKRSRIKNGISRVAQFITEFVASGLPSVTKAGRDMAGGMHHLRHWRQVCNTALLRAPLEAFKIAKALTNWAAASAAKYA